jgi:hypothetical protein
MTSWEICGGQSGTGADFSPNFSNFPLLIIIPPLLHTHLSLPPEICHSPKQVEDCGFIPNLAPGCSQSKTDGTKTIRTLGKVIFIQTTTTCILYTFSALLRVKTNYVFVEFEILRAVTMKSTIFCDVTPCSPVEVWRFGGIYCLYLQGRRVAQARNQLEQTENRETRMQNTQMHSDQLSVSFLLPVSILHYCSTLKMEPVYPSDTLVNFYWTKRRYIIEESTINIMFWRICVLHIVLINFTLQTINQSCIATTGVFRATLLR